jgi:lambda family phage tail tape measure protein
MSDTLGRLVVRIEADIASAASDIQKMRRHADELGSSFASAGSMVRSAMGALGISVGISQVVALTKATIDAADSLQEMSQKISLSVKDLTAYKLMAEQSGTSLDGVAMAVKGLSKYMLTHREEMAAAGISTESTTAALRDMADLVKDMPEGLDRTALATKTLGKGGTDMIPVLIKGSQYLDESRKKTEELGAAMEKFAPQADKFNDNLANIGVASDKLKVTMLQGIVEALNTTIKQFDLAREAGLNYAQALSGIGIRGMGESREDSAKNAYAHIKELQGEQEKLRAGQEMFRKVGATHLAENADVAIAGIDKKIEYYKKLQASVALAGSEGAYSNEGRAGSGNQSAKALARAKILTGGEDKPARSGAGPADLADQESAFLGGLRVQANRAEGDVTVLSRTLEAISSGPAKKFSEATKDAAISLAMQADEAIAAASAARRFADMAEDLAEAQRYVAESSAEFARRNEESVESLRFEGEAIGMTSHQREKANAFRQIERDLNDEIIKQRRILALEDPAKIEATVASLRANAEATKAAWADAYDANTAKADDWATGAKAAMDSYADATTPAQQANALLTKSFKSVEDALVEFARTGKLDFKGLVDSILADIVRIQAQNLTKEISGMFGGAISSSGGGVNWGGLIGSFFGGSSTGAGGGGGDTGDAWGALAAGVLGSFATGTDYVPQTGLYRLHQGEAVVPAAQNTSDAQSARPITTNISFSISGQTDARTQQQIAAQTGLAVQRALRRNT